MVTSSSCGKGGQTMKKTRESGIELLRMMAMLSIIGHHFLKWGGVLDASEFGSFQYIVYWLINGLFFTCVNCFMLITGYFMSESKMKFSRLVKFWFQVLFYSVGCSTVIMVITGHVSLKVLTKALVPLSSQQYWYATHYALILCFVPLLNRLIQNLSKKEFQTALIVLFIIFSVMPTFLVWERDLLTSGRDYPWMMVLYLTGAYIKKYGISVGRKKSVIGFTICFLITGIVRIPLGLISQRMVGSEVLAGLFFRYNSVTVYLGAVLLFNAMRQVKTIRAENAVLILAPLSFAVYLIHDNPNVRLILWAALPITKIMALGVLPTIAALVLTSIGIYLIGCGIEKIRMLLFKRLGFDHLESWVEGLLETFICKQLSRWIDT